MAHRRVPSRPHHEDDLPNDQRTFIPINAELSVQWPMISWRHTAPSGADSWGPVPAKAHLLDPRPLARAGEALDTTPSAAQRTVST